MTELFHIAERDDWASAQAVGEYRLSTRGLTLQQVGFIHCSLRHQLRGVAETFYADLDDLVVLVIDSDRLAAPLRFETPAPGGEELPHIYGPLPIDAVTAVVPVSRDNTGRFELPD